MGSFNHLFPAWQGNAIASVVEDECKKIVIPSKMSSDNQVVKCVKKHPPALDVNRRGYMSLHPCGNSDVLVEELQFFSSALIILICILF